MLVVGAPGLAVVAVEQPPVRVGDATPAPEGVRRCDAGADYLGRVDQLRADGALVSPVVPQVEDVAELVPGLEELAQRHRVGVHLMDRIDVVQEAQLGQVAAIPPGESVVDRLGESVEDVLRRHRENPARPRPEITAGGAAEQFDAHGPLLVGAPLGHVADFARCAAGATDPLR